MTGRRHIAATQKVLTDMGAPADMIGLCDLLGETAMVYCRDHDGQVAGTYVVEIRQDGSLMTMRATAERWDGSEGEPVPPTPEVLAAMYEQIRPSAEAYFAECGERPPLAADLYDLFLAAGFDLSVVERIDVPRVLQ